MKKRLPVSKKIIWLLLLIIAGVKSGWAEDIELDKIVVTPSRIEETSEKSGRKVDVILGKDLKYLNPQSLSEVLEENSSINIRDYGSLGAQEQISMRGSTPSQVLIMIDGRPINSPRSGDVDLSAIPLENIGRVEIMRGPASSLYGSSAMGGVVNIITKQPPKEGQKLSLSSSFGTFRTYQEYLSYGAGFGNLGCQINSGYQSSAGSRENSEFNAKDANAKLTYNPNPENKFSLQGGFYKDKTGIPGTITSPDLNDKQISYKNFFDLLWENKPWQDKDIGLSLRAYQNYERLEFIETPEPLDKTTHTTKSRAVNFKINQAVTKMYRAIWGFDWTENLNDSSASAKHKYDLRAGYLENQIELAEKFKIDLGVRLDDYSNFGAQVSPSLNLRYSFSDSAKLRFLLARSFRAPTFNDLYWPSTLDSAGNPNLQPEKGLTAEFGIEKKFSKFLKIGLTYFRSNYDNLIKWQKDSDNIWRPKNIDSALIQGIEQELQLNPFHNLSIDIGYTFLRAKDEKTGKYLTYQPEHKANLSLLYKGPAGFNFGLKGEFVGRRFDNAANTIYVKEYYVLGLKITKKINNWFDIFTNIDNLLNKKYQSLRGYPLPGFSLTGGIKSEF